jgi:hypothetical protein
MVSAPAFSPASISVGEQHGNRVRAQEALCQRRNDEIQVTDFGRFDGVPRLG